MKIVKCINNFGYPSLTEWKVYEGNLDWEGNIFIEDDSELFWYYPIELFEIEWIDKKLIEKLCRECEDFELEIKKLEYVIDNLERDVIKRERELEVIQKKIKFLWG